MRSMGIIAVGLVASVLVLMVGMVTVIGKMADGPSLPLCVVAPGIEPLWDGKGGYVQLRTSGWEACHHPDPKKGGYQCTDLSTWCASRTTTS
jgi:hypothetical protein